MNQTVVVFDTDPGIDDAMALLLLHALPSIEIRAISTVFGNASIAACTRNALYICERFNLPYPVYQGAGVTFTGQAETDYPDFVHGLDGLGDVGFPAPSRHAESQTSVDYMIETLRATDEPIELLAVGRMTNLAEALRQAPDIAPLIQRIVMMGGAVAVPGNVTQWAEANIYGDPEAAAFVFDSGVPVLMVGLDATLEHRMKKTSLMALRHELGDAGEFLWQIKQCYLKFYADKGIFDGFPIHDSTAALAVVHPDCFEMRRGNLVCETQGEQRGRTVFTESEEGVHEVAMAADSAQLTTIFETAMHAKYGAGSL
jgi:purine nucleosidase